MGSQNLIFSAAIANAAGVGPWVDVGQHGSDWTIHIKNGGTWSVEVSNEIPTPTTPNPNAPSLTRSSYPPFGPPQTIVSYTNENHAIGATVTVTHAPAAGSTFLDMGVTFATGPQAGTNLQFLPSGPGARGTYGVNTTTGVYSFNAADVAAGFGVNLNYSITTPDSGVSFASTTTVYVLGTSPNQLFIAKSDLNVKWVRVIQAAPSTTLAFLHTGKA